VKLHRNAKTTPIMRALLVQRIRHDQWRPAEAAAAAGISVRPTYTWRRRHGVGGPPALEDASSRPRRQPRRTSVETVAAIVAARHERRTAWAIATRLHVPRSTVAAVLVRAGLNRLAHLTPRGPVIRYERRRPGELVHLDIKPLARILRVGHRIHGDRRQIVEGAGYEYAHVAVDDYSRVAYVEVLPDHRGLPPPYRRLVCSTRGHRRTRPDRQWQRVPIGGLCAGRTARPRPTDAQPPAASPDEWEG
jgi:hypothetical protein